MAKLIRWPEYDINILHGSFSFESHWDYKSVSAHSSPEGSAPGEGNDEAALDYAPRTPVFVDAVNQFLFVGVCKAGWLAHFAWAKRMWRGWRWLSEKNRASYLGRVLRR